MDVREIKKLISLMNENGLARLEVEEEGKRYLLEKALPPADPAAAAPLVGMPVPAALAAAAAPAAASAPAPKAEDTVTFNSPMVGSFYRAASPDAEPFVKPGDRIEKDTVICLIEAMKVFNEIKAETTGTIVEILPESGEAVEYNQPLFLIKPN